MKTCVDIQEAVRFIAREAIQEALSDVQYIKNVKWSPHPEVETGGVDALEWFNRRDTTAFGYGWCLEYSGMNPNTMRKLIETYTTLTPQQLAEWKLNAKKKHGRRKKPTSKTSARPAASTALAVLRSPTKKPHVNRTSEEWQEVLRQARRKWCPI